MPTLLSYPIVPQASILPIMTASSSNYEEEEEHYNDNMIFDESYDGNSSSDHEEHGVDEDFLNKLYLIADYENDCTIRTIPAMDDDDDYHVTAYEHDDDCAHMIEDDDSQNESISVDTISSCSGISCNNNMNTTGSSNSSIPSSYSLKAPNSNVDGMVNAYFVVDPINNVVFFPKQTISCQAGDRLQTAEFGPMFLPSFDIKSIHEMNSNVK